MKKDLNRWEGIGRLGQDLELKYLKSDHTPVCHFSIACNNDYMDRRGNVVNSVVWVPCVAIGQQAEFLSSYARKGARLCAIGQLVNRKWTDKDGVEHHGYEIRLNQDTQLLDWPPQGAANQSASTENKSANGYTYNSGFSATQSKTNEQ